MTSRPGLLVLLIAATGLLSGCISLLPKAEPVNLYRLAPDPGAGSASMTAGKVTVLRAPTYFTRAAAGDRILTTTGFENAYVANARWTTPVQLMFDEAVTAAFDVQAPGVRLTSRGESAPPDYILRNEILVFSAVYADPKAAPTITVEIRATLTDTRNSANVVQRTFRATDTAADNRIVPIVTSFNLATAKALREEVAWTAANARPKPATPPAR